MSFASDVNRFVVRIKADTQAVLAGVASEAHESIVGSGIPGAVHPITGAPGQPVDTGTLRNSWTLQVRPGVAEISTNVVYAPGIEDGISQRWGTPMTLRSLVGGFHSVKLTIAGANAILADVLRRLGR